MARGRHPDDDGDWLVVVVRRAGWQRSPFDSYSKTFFSVGGKKSARVQFLDWWFGLDPDSYTRKVANVHLHWAHVADTRDLKDAMRVPDTVDELLKRIT